MPATKSSSAAAESAETGVSHAGEPVVTPHLRLPATANPAEGAAITARILAFKILGTEAFAGRRSCGLATADPFRTTRPLRTADAFRPGARPCIPTETGTAAETIGHRSIRIGNAQPVSGVVRPHIRSAESRVKVAETVAMEEAGIQENAAAEPIRPPSPTPATPQAPAAAEVKP
jgi:hypothetical protein